MDANSNATSLPCPSCGQPLTQKHYKAFARVTCINADCFLSTEGVGSCGDTPVDAAANMARYSYLMQQLKNC